MIGVLRRKAIAKRKSDGLVFPPQNGRMGGFDTTTDGVDDDDGEDGDCG